MNASNTSRAVRCQQTITTYAEGDDFTNLIDLIADAMHWCDSIGQDFHLAFAQTCRHYVHELNKEQHDERRL